MGLVVASLLVGLLAADPVSVSGTYPHLAVFNDSNECGIGAVVPWAGSLWFVTYSPHAPRGSSDRLYEVTDDLQLIPYAHSIGGTPANRLVHGESRTLSIGPYLIDESGDVRVVEGLVGRLTATARHLTHPDSRLYFATMEEGLYEVDVHTLETGMLFRDGNELKPIDSPLLPGVHGKGAYTSQGVLVYANNGEAGEVEPHGDAGCLAEWDGNEWRVIERAQFCEVTGPGGVDGPWDPNEPIWATGFDHRSVLLMLRENGTWHRYRLPKASSTYDGTHGWHTEWPRIRRVGDDRYLMTMHGMLYDFPPGFSSENPVGIRALSSYLRVIADFCAWNGRIVFACNDVSKFDNPTVPQANSNLWFVDPEDLDDLGPRLGWGAVWWHERVVAHSPSDPFLTGGFDAATVYLKHDRPGPVHVRIEHDAIGTGKWTELETIVIPAQGSAWTILPDEKAGEWVRIVIDQTCDHFTAWIHVRDVEPRATDAALLAPLAPASTDPALAACLLVPGREGEPLAAQIAAGERTPPNAPRRPLPLNIDADLEPRSPGLRRFRTEPPEALFRIDERGASVPGYVLPIAADTPRWVEGRELVTERHIGNVGGTFFEVPRPSAGGITHIKPITSHRRAIGDFCSWRGLLVLAGAANQRHHPEAHVVSDGRTGVWVGALDDLWRLGAPRGMGGPWIDTPVPGGTVSDAYLMLGYGSKKLTLFHDSTGRVTFTIEVDPTGDGDWFHYDALTVAPDEVIEHDFPEGFSAWWVRLSCDRKCTATALFDYR